MEVESGVRKHLLGIPEVTGYVQQRVFKFRLAESIEGTGRRALVVRRGDAWSRPDPVSWAEYPVLHVECWADHTRNEDGTIDTADAEESAWALNRVVDRNLHARRDESWGGEPGDGLRVVSSARYVEPVIVPQPNTEAVMVLAKYALTVHH